MNVGSNTHKYSNKKLLENNVLWLTCHYTHENESKKKNCKSHYSSYGHCKLTLLPTYITLFQVFSFNFFLIIFSQWMTWTFFVVSVCAIPCIYCEIIRHPPKKFLADKVEQTDTTSVNSRCMCSTGSSLTNQEPMHVTISITIPQINCWTTTTDLAYIICTTQW